MDTETVVTAQAMLRRVKRDQEALLRGIRIHGNRKGRVANLLRMARGG